MGIPIKQTKFMYNQHIQKLKAKVKCLSRYGWALDFFFYFRKLIMIFVKCDFWYIQSPHNHHANNELTGDSHWKKKWIFSCEFHIICICHFCLFVYATRTICMVHWPNFCLQFINTRQSVEVPNKYECAYVFYTVTEFCQHPSFSNAWPPFFHRSQLPDLMNSRQF